jgi:dihydrofolate reductase
MICMISCMDNNRTIGENNNLPWQLPADLKHFKQVTMGHTIVMGRKTYESIGRALPGRVNVVLTRDKSWSAKGVEVFHSKDEILTTFKGETLFIIGGEQVYNLFMDDADKLYITQIDDTFSGDAFFPIIDKKLWKLSNVTNGERNSANNYIYKFLKYERIQ